MKSSSRESRDCRLQIIDCGVAEYRSVLERQHSLREKRRLNEIPDTVLVLEHLPVITLGARQSANKILAQRSELAEQGIDVVEIRRGGGTTAHNPGQVVFYPVLNLQQLGLGISAYIRTLEAIGIELLEHFGVQSTREKGYPGLWVGERKIASIGVRVSKFVTHHGMAINIRNELSIFDVLIPCGLEGVEMTSVLEETGRRLRMGSVKKKLCELLVTHLVKKCV